MCVNILYICLFGLIESDRILFYWSSDLCASVGMHNLSALNSASNNETWDIINNFMIITLNLQYMGNMKYHLTQLKQL